MKRWYIVPASVYREIDPYNQMPRHSWLYGDSYVELDDAHLLVSADFQKPRHEERWQIHPDVARLTHPQLEQSVPLVALHQRPDFAHKQFQPHHHAKLASLAAQHGFTLNDSHTLWDLHDALVKHYPGLRLTRY